MDFFDFTLAKLLLDLTLLVSMETLIKQECTAIGVTRINLNLGSYTIKVLDAIRDEYDLKSRDEALDKFIDLFGANFVEPTWEPQFTDGEVKELKEETIKSQFKSPVTLKKLDKLLNL